MRGRILPARLGDSATVPDGASGTRLEHHRAEVAELSKAGRVVRSGIECLAVRVAARHSACVPDRCTPGCTPRVEFEDVLIGAWRRILVHRTILGMKRGRDRLAGAVVKVRNA